MHNSNRIQLVRIVACAAIVLVSLGLASLLAWQGLDVPSAWWLLTIVAAGGVAGADIISAVLAARKDGKS